MNTDTIYDLGEMTAVPTAPAGPAAPGVARSRPNSPGLRRGSPRPTGAVASVPAWLPASAAVAIPGAGHLVLGRVRSGLSWLGTASLLGAIVAAVWRFLPRLWQAAAVLGLPSEAAVWTLGAAAAAIALVHPASALSARALVPRGTPHPVVTCSASAIVPGWGQLWNRDLARAGLFLVGTWVVVAAWTLSSHPVQELLVAYRLHLPAPLALLATAPARWALVAGIWPLAVYDAGASAYAARRR